MPRRAVAVVGAGPSGLYTVDALLRGPVPVDVDVIDRLPSPFGLVRYGVAPDHPKIKSVDRVLAKPFATEQVRYIGNVEVGDELSHDDLVSQYDAVVYATGSQVDRSWATVSDGAATVGSAQFVAWYSGHPDTAELDFELDHPSVAIVGGGNVALDIARVLTRSAEEMARTDVPEAVLDRFRSSRVRDVHVIVRGFAHQAKFSYLELLTLEEIAGARVLVHSVPIEDPPADFSGDRAELDRVARNVELLRKWQLTVQEPTLEERRVHFHFGARIAELRPAGKHHVIDVITAAGEEPQRIEVGTVITAIGYRGRPIPGLPFDPVAGVIPNDAGRVVCDGITVPKTYVVGWIKRGPTGVIATNRVDAVKTAAAVLEDLASLDDVNDPPAHRRLDHPTSAISWAGWLRLDVQEQADGHARGAGRVKSAHLARMLEVCRTEAPEPLERPSGAPGMSVEGVSVEGTA